MNKWLNYAMDPLVYTLYGQPTIRWIVIDMFLLLWSHMVGHKVDVLTVDALQSKLLQIWQVHEVNMWMTAVWFKLSSLPVENMILMMCYSSENWHYCRIPSDFVIYEICNVKTGHEIFYLTVIVK